MDDFIFGSLATDELRLKYTRRLLSGITHNCRRLPRDPSPQQTIQLVLTIGPAHACDHVWVYWTIDGSDPAGANGAADNGFVTALRQTGSEWSTLLWGYIIHYAVDLPGLPEGTLLRYRLSAYSSQDGEVFADNGQYYGCYIANDPTPEWSRDAVIYHIFVDRFSPQSGKEWGNPDDLTGFYGGSLQGINEKLDYVDKLGANVIYLSPINPSPSHHGYDTTDFYSIEPRLGSLDDFKELVESIHSRKMHLILDFVPNHCSDAHPIFQKAIHDPNSIFRDWFTFTHWPDQYETFFGVRSLPQINLRHPQARQHILDAACYWLKLGVDGFRLDYAIGPTPDFWADFRKATREIAPDSWSFGEVVDPPDSQLALEGGLDGCLDFVLLEALRQSFAFGRWNAIQLGAFLDRHEAFFPMIFSRPAFLDNHDMNRFIWAAGGDKQRLKLAALCQFSLAGAPLVYYGTEVGLSQARDVRQGGLGLPHESRQPMLWGKEQDQDLLDFYQKLVLLRRREKCLRYGSRQKLLLDSDLLAYSRTYQSSRVAAIFNLSKINREARLNGAWGHVLVTSNVNAEVHTDNEGVMVKLPPISGLIISGH